MCVPKYYLLKQYINIHLLHVTQYLAQISDIFVLVLCSISLS